MSTERTKLSPPTVFIVDDDSGMLKSMETVMEIESIPTRIYPSARAFLDDYDPRQPGCLVVDMQMPAMTGTQLLEHLRASAIHIPAIMVTAHGDVPSAVNNMKLGAVEFLQKPVDPRILVAKVREALELDSVRRVESEEGSACRERLSTLTNRETEALDFLVSGLSNKQIALEMGISIKTVEHHREHIMAKTRAVNGADLVRMKMLNGNH
jgi:FixJ family two-component response regulator